MSRSVPAAALVREQVDLFDPAGSITRAEDVTVSDLTVKVFFNNALVTWPLMDGAAVTDASISSGSVYFHQISGADGYYALRFFPDRVGFWRIIVRHATLAQEVTKEYDVVPGASGTGGLNATFVKS